MGIMFSTFLADLAAAGGAALTIGIVIAVTYYLCGRRQLKKGISVIRGPYKTKNISYALRGCPLRKVPYTAVLNVILLKCNYCKQKFEIKTEGDSFDFDKEHLSTHVKCPNCKNTIKIEEILEGKYDQYR